MDCSEVRKILYEHIEGSSDPGQQVLIEEHLHSCEPCRQSSAKIKKTIETLQGLDEVEPPAWLTAKVMKKIRAEALPRKGWRETLFFPLHIKLPIEAFAALLITVAAIFIYKNMGPELQQMEVQPPAPAKRSILAEPEKETQKEEMPNNIVQPRRLQKAAKQKDSFTDNRAQEMTKYKEEKRPEHILPSPASSPAPASSTIPSPAPPSAVRQTETGKASGMAARDEMMQRAVPAAPVSELPAEKKAVAPAALTVTVKTLDAAKKEIETYLARVNGEFRTIEQSDSHIVITVTLDPAKTAKFLEFLSSIGRIKEQHQVVSLKSGLFKLIIETQ